MSSGASRVNQMAPGMPPQQPFANGIANGMSPQQPFANGIANGMPPQQPFANGIANGMPPQQPFASGIANGMPPQQPFASGIANGMPAAMAYGPHAQPELPGLVPGYQPMVPPNKYGQAGVVQGNPNFNYQNPYGAFGNGRY